MIFIFWFTQEIYFFERQFPECDVIKVRGGGEKKDMQHVKIVASEFPSHIRCFTDESKSGSRTGYAVSIQGNMTLSPLLCNS